MIKKEQFTNTPIRRSSVTGDLLVNLFSYVLIPGIPLLSDGTQAVFYFLALVYIFLGIAIISDIFMAYYPQSHLLRSIEIITA
jgi:Na+/alanine symporter